MRIFSNKVRTLFSELYEKTRLQFSRGKRAVLEREPAAHEAGVALISIVFIVGSIALAMISVVLVRQQGVQGELTDNKEQQENFRRVEAALTAFAFQDFDAPGAGGTAGGGGGLYRLPCPAEPTDGTGDAPAWNGEACNDQRGIVPWNTIGLSQNDVVDQNGNYLTYIVQPGSVAACDGDSPRANGLLEQESAANFAYAIIGHGQNGFGAFRQATLAAATNPTSAEEQANCQVNCGAVITAGQFRSGPRNRDQANFFDDIVRSATFANEFTAQCATNEEEDDPLVAGDTSSNDRPAGSETSFEGSQASTNFNNGQSADRRSAVISEEDPDGMADTGDEFNQVYLRSGTSNPRSSCFWNEGAIELENNSVRAYVEVSFDQDVADTRRGALIMGFLRGDEPIVNSLCGGEDTLLGWEDGPSNTLPNEKLGIELDTEGADNDDALYEPDENHIAILATNIDHRGLDPGPTGAPSREAPRCHVDGPGAFSTIGDGIADPDESTLADMEGCYPNVVNWLESGTTNFHGFRVELHHHANNNCPAPAQDWIRVNAWAFEDTTCVGECESLLSDYSSEAPDVSYCLPYETVFNTLRYGFTSAGPASNSGTASEPRIRRFGIRSELVEEVTKDAADATEETPQLSALNFLDEGGLSCNSGEDAATSIIVDDDIVSDGANPRNPVFSSLRGRLSCNSGGRMGVQGITSERRLDHVNVDVELWEDLFRREGLQIEFPEEVTRYMVHLRDFEDPAENFAAPERSVILAYNQGTYVGRKDLVACSSGDDFFTSGAFNGDAFDRLVVIPEPADQTYSDPDGAADHWIDGYKGCGSENICAPESLSTTNVQGLQSDCYDSDLDSFALPDSVSSSDQTPEMNYVDVNAAYGTNPGAWVNLSDYDMNVIVPSGDDVYFHNTNSRGIGYASSVDTNNHLESDPAESLTFLFDRAFNKLQLNVSRFTESTTAQEQVLVEFKRGSQTIGDATVAACNETGDGDNGARMFEFDTFSLGAFDRVVVTAQPRTSGTTETQVFIRELRACDSISGDCSMSTNASSTCSTDTPAVVPTTVNAP